MSMTRKDFNKLANEFNGQLYDLRFKFGNNELTYDEYVASVNAIDRLIDSIARIGHTFNPAFDHQRFLSACRLPTD